jgi:CHAT domain-containing protein
VARFFGILDVGLALTAMMVSGIPAAAAQIARGSPPESDQAFLRDEAFQAAQSATLNQASAALNKIAARFATGNDEIAALERVSEDLSAQLERNEADVSAALGASRDTRARLRDLVAASSVLRRRIAEISAKVRQLNPGYYDLTRPRPISIARAQGLLKPDEGLILLMVSEDATYVFALSAEKVAWARSTRWNEAALAGTVAELRRGLEFRTRAGADGVEPLPSFDRQAAFELYLGLIQPVEEVFRDKRVLLTATNGALASVPLQVLVTDRPVGADDDSAAVAATRFVADRYAVAVLPGVSSLQALRCLLVAPAKRAPACGDSSGFAKRNDTDRQVEVVGFGAPTLLGEPASLKGTPVFEAAFGGTLADTEFLRRMPYLPGARRELDWFSREYGEHASVKIGDLATELAVKNSRELRTARYVLFSTHGLLSGQGGILGEPGLVFTPPPERLKSPDDDGLLTASEAARLQLSADFVVLSACNTAASDGSPGGEGLSGLARSFFFAGARALLVSNWEVSDDASVELVRGTFGAFVGSGSRDRAAALASAMLKVRANAEWAAPRYWGAYVLVGVPE